MMGVTASSDVTLAAPCSHMARSFLYEPTVRLNTGMLVQLIVQLSRG